MKSFKEILKEEWYNSFLYDNKTIEIFVNPNPKEQITEIASKLTNKNDGIRFFIDFLKRKIYMWNGVVVHGDLFNIKNIDDFTEEKYKYYYQYGVNIDRYFTGTIDSDLIYIESDSYDGDFKDARSGSYTWRNFIEQMEQLLENAKSANWLDKYIDKSQVIEIIQNKIDTEKSNWEEKNGRW